MARTKSNGTNTSTATIGFEAKLWITAEQAVPAPHLADAEYNGGRPQGLLGLIFLKYISDTAGKCRRSNAEIRTRSARPLRQSTFAIRHFPAPTIGKTVDRRMSNAEVRMTNRSRFTSTFANQHSKFA